MRLREGTAIVRRAPGVVQIGGDPGSCIVLENLTSSEEHTLLNACAGERLPPIDSRIFTRISEGSFLDNDEAPSCLPTVALDGIDGVTLAAASLLSSCGVSRFDINDSRPADRSLGVSVPPAFFGGSRRALAQHLLLSHHQEVLIGALSAPDCTIVSRERVVDTVATCMLMSEDRRHLIVLHRETHIQIGPLVIPGETACAQCHELTQTDADPLWPFIAKDVADLPVAPPSVVASHIAALEIARVVLALLPHSPLGPSPIVDNPDVIIRVIRGDGHLSHDLVPAHARCGCGAAKDPFHAGTSVEQSVGALAAAGS